MTRRVLLAGGAGIIGGAGLLAWRHNTDMSDTPIQAPPKSAWPVAAHLSRVDRGLTVTSESVLLADSLGGIRRIDAVDGSEIWKFPIKADNFPGLPMVRGDLVFSGANQAVTSGELIALNWPDGRLRWRLPQRQPILEVTADDTRIFFSAGHTLNGLAAESGESLWSLTLNSPDHVSVSADLVLVTSDQVDPRLKRLEARQADTGDLVWRHEFESPGQVWIRPLSRSAIAGTSSYDPGGPATVAGISRADGRTLWRRRFGNRDARVEAVTESRVVVLDDHHVWALRTDDGGTAWTFRQPPGSYPHVWPAGDLVILAMTAPDEEGTYRIHALNIETGELRWSHRSDKDPQEAVAGTGGIYLTRTGNRDQVLGLGLSDGAAQWEARVPEGSGLMFGRWLYVLSPPPAEWGLSALDPATGTPVT